MPTPRPPLADVEALFLHALQPVLDLAALAGRPDVVSLGVVVGGGLVAALAVALGRPGRRGGGRAAPSSPSPSVLMTRTALLLAAVILAAPAFAQSHAEAMARLAPYAGTYALDGTAQAEEGTFDGSLTVGPILDGHFQQWDWQMTMRGPDGYAEPVALRFIVEHDPATGGYEVYRFDSRDAGSPTRTSRAADPTRGALRFDGDALVMEWPMPNPDDPSRAGTFRNTVRRSAGGLEVVTDVTPDDGSPLVAVATTRAARR